MNSKGVLDLARLFITLSETNSDISLRLWKQEGCFKFHLTNNNRHQQHPYSTYNENSNQRIFSTPPPRPFFQPNVSSQSLRTDSDLHHTAPEPDHTLMTNKGLHILPTTTNKEDEQDEHDDLPDQHRPEDQDDERNATMDKDHVSHEPYD